MTKIYWTNIAGGNWQTAGNWSSSPNPPEAADDAAITLAGSYAVRQAGTNAVSSLLMNDPAGTLDVTGDLNAGTLTLDAGLLLLTGTLANTTVMNNGGTVEFGYGATLANVDWQGPLTIALANQFIPALMISGSLTVTSNDGKSPGIINLGEYGSLDFITNETLNNLTLNVTDTGGGSVFLSGQNLTLGATATLAMSGYVNTTSFKAFDNQGSINLTGYQVIAVTSLDNTGTIAVASGNAEFDIDNGAFQNAGLIQVAAGASLTLAGGAVTPAVFNPAALETIQHLGNFIADGTIDNTGNTVTLTAGSGFDQVKLDGTLLGGTVVSQGGTLLAEQSATLSDVLWQGVFNIDGNWVIDPATRFQPLSSTTEQFNLLSGGLTFTSSRTLDDIQLNVTASGASIGVTSGTLTFGPHATLLTGAANIATFLNGPVINQGTIGVDQAGDTLVFTQLINDGIISLTGSADVLSITGTQAAAALGQIDVTGPGGTIELSGTVDNTGNTIALAPGSLFDHVLLEGELEGGTIVSQGGTIAASINTQATLGGVQWQGLFYATGNWVIDQATQFTAIGTVAETIDLNGGNLTFTGSRTLANLVVDVAGDASIGSQTGTLTLAPSVTIVATGTANGFDNLSFGGTVVNQGSIFASGNGENLDLASTFTNAGWLGLGTDASLTVGSYGVANGFVSTGVIALGDSSTSLVVEGVETIGDLGSLTSQGGQILVDGTLDNAGGTLVLTPGSGFGNLAFGAYGVLQGGTVIDQGGSVNLAGGTLANLVWRGPIDITDATATLDNVTVQDLNGGPGTITLDNATLIEQGNGTLDNVTLNASGSFDQIAAGAAYASVTTPLTIGRTATLNATGAAVTVISTAETIANDGTIAISGIGGTLAVRATNLQDAGSFVFTNAGFINVGGGSLFQAGAASWPAQPAGGTFDNTGLILVQDGGTLDVSNNIATFSNPGTIDLAAAGSTLELDGSVTAAALGVITGGGGQLDITGLLKNTSNTLVIGSGGKFASLDVSGTIQGGTISAQAGSATLNDGTLDGVTWDGPLQISGYVSVVDGLSVRSAAAQPGTIALTGSGTDYLNLLDNETLTNVLLDVAATASGNLVGYGTLTLGATSTITVGAAGVNAATYAPGLTISTAGFINDGLISITSGSGFQIAADTTSFVNTGTIAISGQGNTFALTTASFANAGKIIATDGASLYVDVTQSETFTSSGTISLDASSTLALGGTITRATLAGFTTAGGPLAIAGTLINTGETLTIAPGTPFSDLRIGAVGQTGTIQGGTVIDQGGSLSLQSAVLDDVDWQAPVDLTGANQSLSIIDGTTIAPLAVGSQTTIDLIGSGSTLAFDSETLTNTQVNLGAASGHVVFAGPTSQYETFPNYGQLSSTFLTLTSSTTLSIEGGTSLEGNIINQGLIDDTQGSVTLGTFSPPDEGGGGVIIITGFPTPDAIVDNQGTIRADAGAGSTFTIGDLTTLTNEGLIKVGNGDDLVVTTSTFTNTGTIAIATDGTVTFDAPSLTALGTIAFTDGTLIIDAPGTGVTTTLVNFDPTDQIIVDTANAATFNQTGSVIAVIDNGLTVAALDFTSQLAAQTAFATPGALTDHVLCFLAGTLITTPAGQTPVECLDPGDHVLTAAGQVRPIAWIGQGRVLATRGRRTAATPVIIRKGALAPNVPHHDLHVTKGHALFIDDVLIPVEFLVNHRSILWDDRAQEVAVFHVELETHDVLLANGAPAESYRDDGNRWLFRNANSGWNQPPKRPCAPVLTGGPVVDAVWRRLLDRAGPRPSMPLTTDPDLHLLVDGARLDPTTQAGEFHMFSLRHAPGEVRIASRAAAPQELGLARDPRCLGVAVRRIVVRRNTRSRTIQADDPRLTEGFHAFEVNQGFRWTDGNALLPPAMFAGLAGPMEVVLQIAATAHTIEEAVTRRVA